MQVTNIQQQNDIHTSSLTISSRCIFISAHMRSKLEAEIMWHLRSTCQVMGEYGEQTELLRVDPVEEPV